MNFDQRAIQLTVHPTLNFHIVSTSNHVTNAGAKLGANERSQAEFPGNCH